jgi:hypothetical protein
MFPWHSAALLAVESSHVAGLRFIMFAFGGADARYEAGLMVTEKFAAALEASATLLSGGNIDAVVSRYREHVMANATRLVA